MNKQIQLGNTENGKLQLDLDLAQLVETKMLIQANSGGGKSWLLRLLAERAANQTQVVILDPEGEFASLRERLDILLIGHDGEIQTDTKSAGLLARKLVELRVSTVIDLFDLTLSDRRKFVRLFLESLLALPRTLWNPMLVMIDEGHLFCPERSAGEAESTDAVIGLMSRGRKRGFCGVLATQRLSKLHKDAAAEANNVLIGRTWLDVDQQRAGKTLGMTGNDRQVLRDLDPGQFYAFGPALSARGVTIFRADQVVTTHPKAGERHHFLPPKASDALKQIVEHLADLPQKAEEETRTLADAQRRIATLERELRHASKQAHAGAPSVKPQIDQRAIDTAVAEAEHRWERAYRTAEKQYREQLADVQNRLTKIAALSGVKLEAVNILPPAKPTPAVVPQSKAAPPTARAMNASSNGANGTLPGGERRILTALAQYPQGRSKTQVAILTGYSHRGGGFNNYLSALRGKGYVHGTGDHLRITDDGLEALGSFEELPTGQALVDYWRGQLGKAERAILDVVVNAHPGSLSKEEVAQRAGYEASGGGFNNALSKLRTLELIEGRGELKAAEAFFG